MKKKIRKFFGIADYLEEEQFLQNQHRQGWKMTDFNALTITYTFEKCVPEDYIYQLDFKEQGQADDDYLLLFEDCGWEYFHKYNGWFYFRKKKSEDPDENSIFNDAPSRAEMAKKILSYQSLVLFLLLFPCYLLRQPLQTSNQLSTIIGIIICCFIFGLLLLHLKSFFKLQKIIKQNTQI
jgi:hypothetical protein